VATSFQKFRAQYPEGALVADLISIHDAQYVVRASVALAGEVIATGLAADQTVEVAEDKARDRALSILGLHTDSQPPAPEKAIPDAESSAVEVSISTAQTTPQTTAEPNREDSIEALPSPVPTHPSSDYEEDLAIEEPEEDLGPPIDAVVEQSPPVSEPKTSAAAIALENFNTSALPVDLSDVIAQTDVELRRLGWTSAQGQEYLEKTYGKRSRRQLTDDELMSFLLYLEDQ
jgi:hypothetical protein